MPLCNKWLYNVDWDIEEEQLFGSLNVTIHKLQGLSSPAGHYNNNFCFQYIDNSSVRLIFRHEQHLYGIVLRCSPEMQCVVAVSTCHQAQDATTMS